MVNGSPGPAGGSVSPALLNCPGVALPPDVVPGSKGELANSKPPCPTLPTVTTSSFNLPGKY